MIKTIRKILGMEKFEMPNEPEEFSHLRPVIESHMTGGWSMGKTPENPAIVVQLVDKTVPPLLEQQLKETAELHGFEVEITATGRYSHNNMPHSNMTYADHVGTNPELTQEDYDRMIKENEEKVGIFEETEVLGPTCMCSPHHHEEVKMVEMTPQSWECPRCGSRIGPPRR